MSAYPSDRRPTPFRPRLDGCVLHDPYLARAASECYRARLSALARDLDCTLLTAHKDPAVSARAEALAEGEWEQLRLLGELVLALGGSLGDRTLPRRSSRGRGSEPEAEHLLAGRIEEARQAAELYGRLLSRTSDRVARSVLTRLQATQCRLAEDAEGEG